MEAAPGFVLGVGPCAQVHPLQVSGHLTLHGQGLREHLRGDGREQRMLQEGVGLRPLPPLQAPHE